MGRNYGNLPPFFLGALAWTVYPSKKKRCHRSDLPAAAIRSRSLLAGDRLLAFRMREQYSRKAGASTGRDPRITP